MGQDFGVEIRDRSGVFVRALDAEVEGLTFTTTAPGGCSDCRYLLKRSARFSYYDTQYLYGVRVIRDGLIWSGRIERVRPTFDKDSEYIEVTALGGIINADDQIYTSHTFAATTAIETCVATVRTDLMTKVSYEDLVATGRTLTANFTVTGRRARDVLADLAAFGTSTNVPLFYYVWPDGPAGADKLFLRTRPTTAAYSVDIADINLTFGFDGGIFANRVRVNYNSGASWAVADNTPSQNDLGYTRELVLQASSVTNATDAANIASTALTAAVQLMGSAEEGTVSLPWAIHDATGAGAVLDLWRIRAGNILRVDGLEPSRAKGGTLNWGNSMLIVKTEYAADTGMLNLTFDTFQASLAALIARLTKANTI